jgi:hypothetical protein
LFAAIVTRHPVSSSPALRNVALQPAKSGRHGFDAKLLLANTNVMRFDHRR